MPFYRFSSTSTAADDGYNVIAPNVGTGRWLLLRADTGVNSIAALQAVPVSERSPNLSLFVVGTNQWFTFKAAAVAVTPANLSYAQSSSLSGIATAANLADGSMESAVWTWNGASEWIEVSFDSALISGAELGSAEGNYLPAGHGPFSVYQNQSKIQAWVSGAWVDVAQVSGVTATGVIRTFTWSPVTTNKIRLWNNNFTGATEFKPISVASNSVTPASGTGVWELVTTPPVFIPPYLRTFESTSQLALSGSIDVYSLITATIPISHQIAISGSIDVIIPTPITAPISHQIAISGSISLPISVPISNQLAISGKADVQIASAVSWLNLSAADWLELSDTDWLDLPPL
jgi:hypothetical protein